jgi:hypothetical protein
MAVDPDEIISIDPKLPELTQLLPQLSQPTYSLNNVGKVVVDKKPDGIAWGKFSSGRRTNLGVHQRRGIDYLTAPGTFSGFIRSFPN